MRHLSRKAHLNRTASHRKALFGNLSAALFTHKRIVTTLGKAKFARRFAERMITFARRGDVASRRHVLRYVQDSMAVKTLFDDLGPHFKNRDGGYTRIIKLGSRRGDAAPMAMIELVGFDDITKSEAKTETKSRLKTSQKKAIEKKKSAEEKKPEVKEVVADAPVEKKEIEIEEPVPDSEEEETKTDEPAEKQS